MKSNTTKILVRGFGHVRLAPRGKKGIYSVSFYYKGKHCRKTLKTADEATAIQRAASAVRSAIDRKPIEFPDQEISFQDGFDIYLSYLKSNGSSPSTIQQFRTRNRVFLDYLSSIGIRRFGEITPRHADLFRSHVRKSRGASTTFGYYKCVRAMLRFLVSRDLIERDPFLRLKFSRPQFRRSVKPTLDEVNRILARVDDRFVVPISALAFLGCRSQEMTLILRKDVDREKAQVLIRKPEKYRSKTKTHFVPIHPRLEEILSNYQRPRSKWYFCSLPYKLDRKGGKKLVGKVLNQEFKRAAKAAGFPTGIRVEGGMTLHSLRGFFKSHALISGIPREVVDTWQAHCADRSASFVHYFDLPDEASQRYMRQIDFDGRKHVPDLTRPVTSRAFYCS